ILSWPSAGDGTEFGSGLRASAGGCTPRGLSGVEIARVDGRARHKTRFQCTNMHLRPFQASPRRVAMRLPLMARSNAGGFGPPQRAFPGAIEASGGPRAQIGHPDQVVGSADEFGPELVALDADVAELATTGHRLPPAED